MPCVPEKNSLVKEFLVNRHAEIMRNRAQVVVRDGLADFALTRGQHLDVDFSALLDGVRQTERDVKVRPGGKQPMLRPDSRLIVLHQLGCRHGNRRAAGNHPRADADAFRAKLHDAAEYLASSRPTAVNLRWALERMEGAVKELDTVDGIRAKLLQESEDIHDEDIRVCRKIGEYGLELVKPGWGLLTHCNAGQLATVKYGTATAPIYLGQERGYHFKVFADETRPLLQGARLTASELHAAGVDVTLICDNMASLVMKEGKINACFVGCDRVARNGDTANKIGTSGVAILAKHYGIPFYVLGPSSTIDFTCPDGDHIPIELRDGGELKEKFFSAPVALPQVKCYNPAFDVTDHSLITAIVTEKGICYPPFEQSFAQVFGRPEKEAT